MLLEIVGNGSNALAVDEIAVAGDDELVTGLEALENDDLAFLARPRLDASELRLVSFEDKSDVATIPLENRVPWNHNDVFEDFLHETDAHDHAGPEVTVAIVDRDVGGERAVLGRRCRAQEMYRAPELALGIGVSFDDGLGSDLEVRDIVFGDADDNL